MTGQTRAEIIDEEQLRLLAIGHYITGGLCILFASIFIFHFVFMLFFAVNPEFFGTPGNEHIEQQGVLKVFAAVLGLFILAGWSFGGLTIYCGRCIRRRARRTLTLVVGCVNLLFIPIGTILGVATLLVLSRPGVKHLYGG